MYKQIFARMERDCLSDEYFQVKSFLVEEALSTVDAIDQGEQCFDIFETRERSIFKQRRDYQFIADYLGNFEYYKAGILSPRKYRLVMKYLATEHELLSFYEELHSQELTDERKQLLKAKYPASTETTSGLYNACQKVGIDVSVAQKQILDITTRIRKANWIYGILD